MDADDASTIKLADFGLAIRSNGALIKSLCGSSIFVSPDVFLKDGYSFQTDVYSLGIVLYL
jgi:serine/threonine protein kinase